MGSVVIELQREALDREVRVSDLLRKALVVSRKLRLGEFQGWIEKELNGYGRVDDVPDYREVAGQVRAWNPMRGWIPVLFPDPRQGELLSHRRCGQSIAELEHLMQGVDDESTLQMPFPQEIQQRLNRGFPFQTEVTLFVPPVALVGIVDTVRTVILNWALKLEEDGILGEALSFTRQEKDAAEKSPQNVTNFFGPVQSPQIQQASTQPIQISVNGPLDIDAIRAFATAMRQVLDSIGIHPEQKEEAAAELRTIESQIESPKPKASIIREGLESLRRILEGAGGGAAGQLLLELGKLLL